MTNSYRLIDEEYPEDNCGYCEEASTYNEDRQCWCDKYHKEVCESHRICDKFIHI